MGQGTESCGGYDMDYDPYDDERHVGSGVWTQRDGSTIRVSDMSIRHLNNTLRMVRNLARSATFSSEEEKWDSWVEIFEEEIARRAPTVRPKIKSAAPCVQRGSKVTMICHCGAEYEARTADIKRGWGLSCSKRCASIRRDFGRPAARRKI